MFGLLLLLFIFGCVVTVYVAVGDTGVAVDTDARVTMVVLFMSLLPSISLLRFVLLLSVYSFVLLLLLLLLFVVLLSLLLLL